MIVTAGSIEHRNRSYYVSLLESFLIAAPQISTIKDCVSPTVLTMHKNTTMHKDEALDLQLTLTNKERMIYAS